MNRDADCECGCALEQLHIFQNDSTLGGSWYAGCVQNVFGPRAVRFFSYRSEMNSLVEVDVFLDGGVLLAGERVTVEVAVDQRVDLLRCELVVHGSG